MSGEAALADLLRTQLIGQLHVGRLRPGSRLPSIRDTAERHQVDHRVASRAYARLETERLVEIRGRSGVFVSPGMSSVQKVMDSRQHWAADVMIQAWSRRISPAELRQLMRQMTSHGLRCLCVESTLDHLVAVSSELASDFGFVITPMQFDADSSGRPMAGELARLAQHLTDIDVVITTAFHAADISEFAKLHSKEFVSITVNPAMRDEVERQVRKGPLRVVAADPRFKARAERFLPEGLSANVQVVLVSEYQAAAEDEHAPPTVFTKAARRELGLGEMQLLTGDVAFIGPDSAAAICNIIVRLST